MNNNTDTVSPTEVDFYYKTPSYTRKAYKAYYDRNKDNGDFVDKRRLAQKEYYIRNKEQILEKKRLKREAKKAELAKVQAEAP